MKPGNKNSYKSLTSININGKEYTYFSLKIAEKNGLKGAEKLGIFTYDTSLKYLGAHNVLENFIKNI